MSWMSCKLKLLSAGREQKAGSSLPGVGTHFTERRVAIADLLCRVRAVGTPVSSCGVSICKHYFVTGKWTWRQLFSTARKSAVFSF